MLFQVLVYCSRLLLLLLHCCTIVLPVHLISLWLYGFSSHLLIGLLKQLSRTALSIQLDLLRHIQKIFHKMRHYIPLSLVDSFLRWLWLIVLGHYLIHHFLLLRFLLLRFLLHLRRLLLLLLLLFLFLLHYFCFFFFVTFLVVLIVVLFLVSFLVLLRIFLRSYLILLLFLRFSFFVPQVFSFRLLYRYLPYPRFHYLLLSVYLVRLYFLPLPNYRIRYLNYRLKILGIDL